LDLNTTYNFLLFRCNLFFVGCAAWQRDTASFPLFVDWELSCDKAVIEREVGNGEWEGVERDKTKPSSRGRT
jgi:hypothetical protein